MVASIFGGNNSLFSGSAKISAITKEGVTRAAAYDLVVLPVGVIAKQTERATDVNALNKDGRDIVAACQAAILKAINQPSDTLSDVLTEKNDHEEPTNSSFRP